MTTVAARDGIMAADTQGCFESIKMKLIKIIRVHGELFGCCGDYDKFIDFIELCKQGKIKDINGSDKDADFDYLLLNNKGLYLATGFRGPQVKIHEGFFAIGSGKEAAITAMRMGASAKEAVKMAHLCDVYTGSEVQVKKL